MNNRNRNHFLKDYIDEIPHISKEQVIQFVTKANCMCSYSKMTVVPKHDIPAFLLSVERERERVCYVAQYLREYPNPMLNRKFNNFIKFTCTNFYVQRIAADVEVSNL